MVVVGQVMKWKWNAYHSGQTQVKTITTKTAKFRSYQQHAKLKVRFYCSLNSYSLLKKKRLS